MATSRARRALGAAGVLVAVAAGIAGLTALWCLRIGHMTLAYFPGSLMKSGSGAVILGCFGVSGATGARRGVLMDDAPRRDDDRELRLGVGITAVGAGALAVAVGVLLQRLS